MLKRLLSLSFALALLGGALFLSRAHAQEPTPMGNVTLTVNAQDLKVIGDALAALPYKDIAPLMQKLQGQIAAQKSAPTDANGNKVEKK